MSPRRTRILVVEDDRAIRSMLSMALEEAGHEVQVHDGRGRVEADGVDLIVMDVRLGERTAHDLLHAQPELAQRPLVFMTAGSDPGTLGDLPEAAVLRKPFDLTALETAVAYALDGERRRATSAARGGDHRAGS